MLRFIYALIFTIFSFSIIAQTRNTQGSLRQNAFSMHSMLRSSSPYKNLNWRNVGPDLISGRCTEVLGVPGNKNIMYASFASGGFWKTSDAGETWLPLSDQIGTLSIGSFDVSSSDPNIIYLGTGEANIFRASLPGMGAYKSTDGGKLGSISD